MKKKLRVLAIVVAGFGLGCAVGLENTLSAVTSSCDFVVKSVKKVAGTADFIINK